MRKGRKIFLNIILLLAVFFCSGIFSSANFNGQQFIIEKSQVSDNTEDKITPDIDFSDEDQMDQSFIFRLSRPTEWQSPNQYSFSVFNIFSVSVWQPPKIS